MSECNHLINERVIRRGVYSVVLPKKVFHHAERFVLNYIGIQQHNTRLTRHQPFRVVNIVSALSEYGGRLPENILRIIEWFEFCLDATSHIRPHHAVWTTGMPYHRRCLRTDNSINTTHLVTDLPCN